MKVLLTGGSGNLGQTLEQIEPNRRIHSGPLSLAANGPAPFPAHPVIRDSKFESISLQRRVTQIRSIPTDLEGLASAWRSLPVGAPLTVRRRPLTGASVVLAPTCAGECAWQIKRASSRRARRRADRLGRQGGMRQPVGAVPSVPAIFPASAWKQGPTITVSPTTVTSHCWVGIGSAARRRRRAVDQICSGRSP